MIKPYSPPLSDLSEARFPLGISLVRWTRPTFATFASLALLNGFSVGVVLAIVQFTESLFGIDTEFVFGIWKSQGMTAGLVGLLLVPVGCAILGLLPITLYPLFRLGVFLSKGVTLTFQANAGAYHSFHLSHLRFLSHIKLSAILGFLFPLLGSICLVIAYATGDGKDFGCTGVPLLFDGVARVIWVVVASPLLFSLYAAVLGVFTFLPFRCVARLTGVSIQSHEIVTGGLSQPGH